MGTGMTSAGGPEVHSTEQCVHSNSAWFCGPKEALEDSHVHSAHTFCFTHGGHRDEHFPFFPQLLNEIKDDPLAAPDTLLTTVYRARL